jgi:CheY-like chemotaxis protein
LHNGTSGSIEIDRVAAITLVGPATGPALVVMVIDIRKLNYARRILWKSLAYRAGSVYGLDSLKEKRQLKTRPLIAVVDDDGRMCVAMSRLLRSAHLDVETFPSGAAFLESLKSHQPDCVVLDIHMPEMDGFEVQARLMEAAIHLPIVIVTGDDCAESRERALASGASAYLSKPMDGQTLLDAITTAIAHPPEASPSP